MFRIFFPQSLKGGKFGAFNQVHESPITQENFDLFQEEFKLITEELIEIIDCHMNYLNKFK